MCYPVYSAACLGKRNKWIALTARSILVHLPLLPNCPVLPSVYRPLPTFFKCSRFWPSGLTDLYVLFTTSYNFAPFLQCSQNLAQGKGFPNHDHVTKNRKIEVAYFDCSLMNVRMLNTSSVQRYLKIYTVKFSGFISTHKVPLFV